MVKTTAGFYAVATGRNVGVYRSWDDCQAQTRGYSKARFKKFKTMKEAQDFIAAYATQAPSVAVTRVPSSSVRPTETNKKRALPTDTRQSSIRSSSPPNGSATPHLTILIHFDGGSRGNPGLAGSGAAVSIRQSLPLAAAAAIDESAHKRHKPSNSALQKNIHVCRFVGMKHTNNQAEYQGVIDALTIAKDEILKATQECQGLQSTAMQIEMTVHGDSDLVIQQLKGSWQCRNERLVPLCEQAKRLLQDIAALGRCKITLTHVYRHLNGIADGLANLAMDTRETFMTTDEDSHTSRLPFG